MVSGSRLSARAYIRSRQVQKSSSGWWGSLRSTRPRSARWKAWLCAFTKPGASARPGSLSPPAAGPTSTTRPLSTVTATLLRAPCASRSRSGRRVRLTLVEHRHPDTQPACRLAGHLVARVGVTDDAYGRVVGQDPFEAGRSLSGAVGEDLSPGVDGLADSHAPAVVDRDPARSARGVEESVEDRPVGYGVGSILHRLGLAVGGGDAPGIQVVAPDDDGGRDGPVGDEVVEAQPRPVARASPEPADARREPLTTNLLSCLLDPAREALVFGEELEDRVVCGGDIVRVPRESCPPEWPLALAEERPYVGRDEAGVGECPVEAAEPRLRAQVVAVVEDLRPALLHGYHRGAVTGHGGASLAHVALRVAPAQPGGLLEAVTSRDVAAQRVVGRRLVRDGVWDIAVLQEGGEDLGGVADDADGERDAFALGFLRAFQSIFEVIGEDVEVAGLDAALRAGGVHLDAEGYALVHGDRERLGAAHSAEASGEADAPAERPAEALFGDGGEGLVGSLEDALGADVDPGPGGHLAVHREPRLLELPERLPVGPVWDEERVGDEDARREGVGAEDRDWLARLHKEGLVIVEALQGAHDGPEALPVAGCLARAAVDDEILWALCDLGVEVVHEHTEGRLLVPALAGDLRPPRRPDGRGSLRVGHRWLLLALGSVWHRAPGKSRAYQSTLRLTPLLVSTAPASPGALLTRAKAEVLRSWRSLSVLLVYDALIFEVLGCDVLGVLLVDVNLGVQLTHRLRVQARGDLVQDFLHLGVFFQDVAPDDWGWVVEGPDALRVFHDHKLV